MKEEGRVPLAVHYLMRMTCAMMRRTSAALQGFGTHGRPLRSRNSWLSRRKVSPVRKITRWHTEIAENHVVVVLAQPFQRLMPIVRRLHRVPIPPQEP
jgi:hypothetical protein